VVNRQRFQNQPAAAVSDERTAALFHWLFTFLLAAAFVWDFTAIFTHTNFSNWPEAALVFLAASGTVASLARQLPLQNVLLAAFVIALIGGGVSALGALTGIPFGPFTFGAETGPQLFKTLPWAMPFVWVVAVVNSRGVARLILRPWRKTRNYGFWLIGITAVLTMLFDLALDPFASRVKHYWLWTPAQFSATWQGAPPVNFFGWTVVTLLMLAFVTPALINKHPVKKSPPDFHPLAVWLGGVLLFGTACALHGLWLAVATDAAIGIITAVFAIRGGRW
jgi:putative membrane protein